MVVMRGVVFGVNTVLRCFTWVVTLKLSPFFHQDKETNLSNLEAVVLPVSQANAKQSDAIGPIGKYKWKYLAFARVSTHGK